MKIRPEKSSEFPIIYDFVKLAFQTAKVANGNESNYVDKLRKGNNYLPELALVAEEGGEIIGHIMLTKAFVTCEDSKFESLLLAPLSVALGHRNCGIGSKLVLSSFDLAKKLGYSAVFVVGDPDYYCRFGFMSSANFGIVHVPEIPSQYVMVCELVTGVLVGFSGTVTFT